MAKELSIETKLKMNRTLRSLEKKAEGNRNFANRQLNRDNASWRHKPLFAGYPLEVRKLAWEYFSSLCIKYKERLAQNPSFKGPLVATATHLALDALNGNKFKRKGFHKMRVINLLKVKIGIRDKFPYDRRKKYLEPRNTNV